MSETAAAIALFLAVGQADANAGFVDDPEKCEMQWSIRLESHRNMNPANGGWPEQLILDANIAGDRVLAQRYMERFGWFSAATGNLTDQALYFMPDTTPSIGSDPRFRKRVAADPSEGIKLACYAAWISGVPFVRVTKRATGGSDVLYSVTNEKLSVEEY